MICNLVSSTRLRILRCKHKVEDPSPSTPGVYAYLRLPPVSAGDSEVQVPVNDGSVFGCHPTGPTFKSIAYEVPHTMPLSDTAVNETHATSSASAGKLESSSTSEPVDLKAFFITTPASVSSIVQCGEQSAKHDATVNPALFPVELAEASALKLEVPRLASIVEVPSMSIPHLASDSSPQPGYCIFSSDSWAAYAVHLLTS